MTNSFFLKECCLHNVESTTQKGELSVLLQQALINPLNPKIKI